MYVRDVFYGMRPRASRLLLKPGEADYAIDCDFRSGAVRPLAENVPYATTIPSQNAGAIPLGVDAKNEPIFKFVPYPTTWVETSNRTLFRDINDDSPDRRSGSAKYIDHASGVSGASYNFSYPHLPDIDRLQPSYTTIASTDSNSQSFTHAISLYNPITGFESSLSLPTAPRLYTAGTEVSITITQSGILQLRAALAGNDLANTQVRLYRNTTGHFQLVDIHDGDIASGNDLGRRQSLPTTGNLVLVDKTDSTPYRQYPWPGEKVHLPSNLEGIGRHPNNFLYAWKGDEVYLSDPNNYAMFPESYTLKTEHAVASVQEHLNRLVVFYENYRHQVLEIGATPASRNLVSPENARRAISADAISKVNGGIVYACNEGIAITDGYNSDLMAGGQHFDETSFREWRDGAGRIFLVGGEDDVIIRSESQTRLAYFQEGTQMTMLSDRPLNIFWHHNSFWAINPNETPAAGYGLYRMFHSPRVKRKFTYRSDPKMLQDRVTYKAARAVGVYHDIETESQAGYGVTGFSQEPLAQSRTVEAKVADERYVELKIMADDVEYEVPAKIRSSHGFNFPRNNIARRWQVEITGNAEINQVALATQPSDFAQIGIGTTPEGSRESNAGGADELLKQLGRYIRQAGQ